MLLVNPAYEGVTEDWFRPEFWNDNATPVSSGGRGGAWFISSNQGDLVLRQYRRGGLVAKVSETHYLFAGENSVRSISEFRLLEELYAQGLPVPQPVGAYYHRSGLFYQTAIIIERIQPAITFGAIWKDAPEDVWVEIGKVVRRFHDADIFHADLNCFNVLLRGKSVYLIDFDKGKRIASISGSAAWKAANLSRLRRSLQRQVTSPADQQLLSERWSNVEQGYQHH